MPNLIRSPVRIWLYLFLLSLVWLAGLCLSYFDNQSKHTASYHDRAEIHREMDLLKQSITHFEQMSKIHHRETQELIIQLGKELRDK